MESSTSQNVDYYSTSSTITTFDRQIPLLRGPVRAGSSDDPSNGPFVLAFRDVQAWKSAYKACQSRIIEQCETGVRIGCALSASSKCKPPWWAPFFGSKKGFDLKERERCEEREMEACLAAEKEKCIGYAKEKCLKSFRDARIALSERRMREKEAEKWVCWASMANRGFLTNTILLSQCGLGETNYPASKLVALDNDGKN